MLSSQFLLLTLKHYEKERNKKECSKRRKKNANEERKQARKEGNIMRHCGYLTMDLPDKNPK